MKDPNNGDISFSFNQTIKNNNLPTTLYIWGTKWDAYNPIIEINNDKEVRIRFKTAWNPPIQWVKTVCNNFDIYISIYYAEEGLQFYGSLEITKYSKVESEFTIIDKEFEYDMKKEKYIRKGKYKEFCDTWLNGIPDSG